MDEESIVSETTWIAVIRPVIDDDACVLCGTCTEFCPDTCLTINDEGKRVMVDYECCLGCAMCEAVCPEGAIEMTIEEVEP
jgi:2-oxoacid:acceptor oxidoreductase delta subunit (pyruvate/2-ketoisovalerate family)